MMRNNQIFNSRLHALKKEKAKHTFAQATFLAQEIEHVLWQRIEKLRRHFDSICILGCPTGYLMQQVTQKYPKVVCAESAAGVSLIDREALPFQNSSFDLVIDGFGLHWVNDFPRALLEVSRVIVPGGLYFAGFLGEHTLNELRQVLIKTDLTFFSGAYARVSPFLKLQTVSELLMVVGFLNPVVDHEELEVHYPSLFQLITDLRRMGETNCLLDKQAPFKRNYFQKAQSIYAELFSTTQGKIKATFDCVYLVAENRKRDMRKAS
jgi:SAM-dependent methyltransferase